MVETLSMSPSRHLSDFLNYLAATMNGEAGDITSSNLPSIKEISKDLGVSVASVREQLEVAKALGLVEVRPRTGIRRLPYEFSPAVQKSLSYALESDPGCFEAFSDLRNHVEASYWYQAVRALTPEDRQELQALTARAREKLLGTPIQIPHQEHRQLHIIIYRRLNNVFVQGLLEAYWDAYEAVGLNVFTDYNYLQKVWSFHQNMVDAIDSGNYESGYEALIEHMDLIYQRPQQKPTPESKR
jgi:DNA-binding FadR family transcriptional regulator